MQLHQLRHLLLHQHLRRLVVPRASRLLGRRLFRRHLRLLLLHLLLPRHRPMRPRRCQQPLPAVLPLACTAMTR